MQHDLPRGPLTHGGVMGNSWDNPPYKTCASCGQAIQREAGQWLLVTGDYSKDRVSCEKAGWGQVHYPRT